MREIILIAVEERKNRDHIGTILRNEGYLVLEAESGQRALDLLQRQADIASILAQIDLFDMKGANFVDRLHAINAHIPIIALTRTEAEPQLIQALDCGLDDFLPLPPSPLRLKVTLNGVLRRRTLADEAHRVRRYAEEHLTFKDLVAKSAKMQDLVARAKRCVRTQDNIMLYGETGCEHELLARIIHRENQARQGSLVRFQCMERARSEETDHHWHLSLAAKLVEARHGSLLLADIDRLDRPAQQHLLPIIEQARRNVGENIRFFATTTVVRSHLTNEMKFNPQLLELLEETRLEIAPLRLRRQDIETLCQVILKVVVAETGRFEIGGIGARALALCQNYDWPGNLAELENSLFRAVLLSEGPILSVRDFPRIWRKRRFEMMNAGLKEEGLFLEEGEEFLWDETGHIRRLSEIEKLSLDAALQRYGGRLSEVARRLGISRATLYRKMAAYQIDAKTPLSR